MKQQAPELPVVNHAIIDRLVPKDGNVIIQKVSEAAIDERGSFVGDKEHQGWLWQAIDPDSGAVLAYVWGTQTDPVFFKLKTLFAPWGISRVDTADWGTSHRYLHADHHDIGKEPTQKIERQPLTLRTRRNV
jgi:insertion element IS1 protein InsB